MDNSKTVAYISSEYALSDDLPIFAGGLGVLAADYFLEARKSAIPFYFVGLLYHHGFIEDWPEGVLDPTKSALKLLKDENDELVLVDIDIFERPLLAKVWIKEEGNAHLLLLDLNTTANEQESREITAQLYGPDQKNMLAQQLVLGLGSVKLLNRLGIKPAIFHLNEGHTSFTILALVTDYLEENPNATLAEALSATKQKVVATKHTILHSSGIFFDRQQFDSLLTKYLARHKLNADEIYKLGNNYTDPANFSTNALLLNNCVRGSCVSGVHCAFEIGVHPNSTLIPVTNGVYKERWQDQKWQETKLDDLPDEKFSQIHQDNKSAAFKFLGLNLDPNYLTVVWSRRLAQYKRPLLIFSDLERLNRLVNDSSKPVQIIISGVAHRKDKEGQEIVAKINEIVAKPEFSKRIVYLPHYGLTLTKNLINCADLWLNNPEMGKEACGTSGMKAGLNGALEFTVPDGWAAEVDWTNIGWSLPDENAAENIYKILETEIVPCFYDLKPDWIARMRKTIALVENHYTTKRMMEDYLRQLYFPTN